MPCFTGSTTTEIYGLRGIHQALVVWTDGSADLPRFWVEVELS